MKGSAVLLLLLVVYCASAEPVYKVVDDQGRVTYTDQPPEGEQPAELPSISSVPAPPVAELPEPRKTALFKAYRQVVIVEPSQDAVLGIDQSAVVVRVKLEPLLQRGHRIQFYYDGEPHGEPELSQTHLVDELERGSHTFSARVVDSRGVVIGRTSTITVHVQRPIIRAR